MQRVTNPMLRNTMLSDMHNNLNRLLNIQKDMATGKLHHRPSDDPVEVVRELSMKTDLWENAQYRKNLDDGLTWLSNSDTALDQITNDLQRVHELAVYAGNGALEEDELEGIAKEIDQIQENLRSAANYSIEGRYVFSGLATSQKPFTRDADGNVVYNGNDGRVQYEMEKGTVSDVSLNGRQVFPQSFDQYVLTSVDVPLDFRWSGRSEAVEIRVGDRHVEALIPEKNWSDNSYSTVPSSNATDLNRFRDPGELEGYTLDELAKVLNSSMDRGDVDRLISVEVVKDEEAGTQRLQIRSHTGEPVSINSWPETDPQVMPRGIEGINVDDSGMFALGSAGSLDIKVGDDSYAVELSPGQTLQQLAENISKVEGVQAKVIDGGTADAHLAVFATSPGRELSVTASGGAQNLFGDEILSAKEMNMPEDHSHIDLFGLLDMETSLKSVEVSKDASALSGLTGDDSLHWYMEGGRHHAELLINSGPDMTVDDLAEQIRGIAGEWLEVVVETDPGDKMAGPDTTGDNAEEATRRLVLRTKDGQSLNIMDMNPSNGKANSTSAQDLGLSTVLYAKSGGNFPSGGKLDPQMPAYQKVMVGDREYRVRLYREDIAPGGKIDAEKVAEEIERQIGGDQIGHRQLDNGQIAIYARTGEPLRIVDTPFGDPALSGYSGGIAAAMGVSSGITGAVVADGSAAASDGSIRIESQGHSIDVAIAAGETPRQLAERIDQLTNGWLDVAYVDGDLDGSGGQLCLSARDGSALSVFDVRGSAAQDFGIDNAVRAKISSTLPSTGTLDIKVAGYTHTIDLAEIDSVEDLKATINSRFQGQDVRAELIDDGGDKYLVLTSPRGYNVDVESATDLLVDGTGTPVHSISSKSRGSSSGPYSQTVTSRTGANRRKTDFFGLLDDLASAVRNKDAKGISNSLLGKISDNMDNLLKCRTEVGALHRRYDASHKRLEQNNINMTDLYSKISDTDIAKAATEFSMAQAVYQSSLAVLAKIVQPTLVDFLR